MMPFEPSRITTSNNHAGSFEFESFLDGWLVHQEHYHSELFLAQQQYLHESPEEDIRELVARVLAHYQQHYEQKSRALHQNVFMVISPSWFTPLEMTFLWIGGFKPGLAFPLVASSVNDLTEDQSQGMYQLRTETEKEERALTEEFAKVQESVAAPRVLEAVRRAGRQPQLEGKDVQEGIATLRMAMESVLSSADSLRMKTVERVVKILSPVQNLKFFTTATRLQIKIRTLGMQKEAERQVPNGW